MHGCVDTKRAVVRALAGTASGVLLDPEVGAAHAIIDGSLPGGVGLIVAVETSGYTGPATARTSSLLMGWSVSQAKRMGADAVKLLLYYHPDADNAAAQESLLMEVAEECADVDMPLFLETLGFSIDASEPKLSGDIRRDVVVRTAHRLTALGGDVLKCEFPYDPSVTDRERWAEACREIDEASAIPWVILSAGVDDATFEARPRRPAGPGPPGSSSADPSGVTVSSCRQPSGTPGWPRRAWRACADSSRSSNATVVRGASARRSPARPSSPRAGIATIPRERDGARGATWQGAG